jgi:hypothetical protein
MKGGPYKIEETALNVLCQLPWQEGNVREFIRFVQDMRKKDGFTVGDMRTLVLDTQGEGTAFVEKWKNEIMRANQLKHISYESPTEGIPLSLGALSFKIKII